MSDRHCTTLYTLIYLYPYRITVFPLFILGLRQ